MDSELYKRHLWAQYQDASGQDTSHLHVHMRKECIIRKKKGGEQDKENSILETLSMRRCLENRKIVYSQVNSFNKDLLCA